MIQKRWMFHEVNRAEQMALASLLSISPITASILIARGIATGEQAQQWLSPQYAHARDPFLLPDMEKAIDRLHRAVVRGERICFYGDYDVDGMAATSIYVTFFRHLGAHVSFYIPDRLREGYGLNDRALHRLSADGVTLLVTSDCGTTAHHEVATANSLGMDVIVTDHHQDDGVPPPALSVLNPFRGDSLYPFSGLCSGGLAYKMVKAYEATYGNPACASDSLLDLVAMATIADVVPLQDENRTFVREGLALISRGTRVGIRALKQAAGIEETCTAGTVAFRLAPRLNAAGRLAHAGVGVRLLTTDSESEAKDLASQLEQMNRERQQIEEAITAEAVAMVDLAEVPSAIVLAMRHWHLGVVGIVAARLVERYHRPAVVIAINEDGLGKGSARSVPGFDLYRALAQCRDKLEGFGGHPSAAGLTIRASRIQEFARQFAGVAEEWSGGKPLDPLLPVDAEVRLSEMQPRLIREFDQLHPFGVGNPEPTLVGTNLTILSTRLVGDGHLKLTVRQGHSLPFESIGFRMGPLERHGVFPAQGVDLAFMPELNRWNGLDRIQLRIRGVRATQTL